MASQMALQLSSTTLPTATRSRARCTAQLVAKHTFCVSRTEHRGVHGTISAFRANPTRHRTSGTTLAIALLCRTLTRRRRFNYCPGHFVPFSPPGYIHESAVFTSFLPPGRISESTMQPTHCKLWSWKTDTDAEPCHHPRRCHRSFPNESRPKNITFARPKPNTQGRFKRDNVGGGSNAIRCASYIRSCTRSPRIVYQNWLRLHFHVQS